LDIKILPLTKEHLSDILEIEKTSFPVPWTREMFEREIGLAISRFFVAMSGERLVAYGGYWAIDCEAHLVNIAVHPSERSKGLGKEFLSFLIKDSAGRKLSRMLLEVRKSNSAAQSLYRRFGFEVSGIRPKYYGDEDAVLMHKDL